MVVHHIFRIAIFTMGKSSGSNAPGLLCQHKPLHQMIEKSIVAKNKKKNRKKQKIEIQTTMRMRKKCNCTWRAIFQLKCNTNTSLQMNRPISMAGIFVFFLHFFRCCHAWKPSLPYWFYNSFTFHPLFRIKWTHFAGLCFLRDVNFASSSLVLFILDLGFSFSFYFLLSSSVGFVFVCESACTFSNVQYSHRTQPSQWANIFRPFEWVLRLHNRRCHNVT